MAGIIDARAEVSGWGSRSRRRRLPRRTNRSFLAPDLLAVGEELGHAVQLCKTLEIGRQIHVADGALGPPSLPAPFEQQTYRRGIDLGDPGKIYRHLGAAYLLSARCKQ